MSSPVNDDQDKRYMYAPPWARETPQQAPDAIVAAVERLRLERQRKTGEGTEAEQRPAARDATQNELPLNAQSGNAQSEPDDIEAALAHAIRSTKWTPHSLDPVAMPDPPKPRLDGPTWGMVLRLGGAIGAAAVAALIVTGALRLPAIDLSSIEVSVSSGESAKAASSAVQAFGIPDARAAKSPAAAAGTMQQAAPPQTPAPPPIQAAAPTPSGQAAPGNVPSEILAAYASLDTKPAAAALASRSDNAQTPSVAPPPKLPELRAIDRDELSGLARRAQALLSEGDIASARLLLRRAAEAGDVNAALTLARTYDRTELAKMRVLGVAADHAQAKLWYTKAVELGSAEAVRRLQQLAQRTE